MLNYAAARVIPLIDHTDLAGETADKNTSTSESVEELCVEALRSRVAAVCVWPDFVKQARRRLLGSSVKVTTVVNFPRGGIDSSTVADEISKALTSVLKKSIWFSPMSPGYLVKSIKRQQQSNWLKTLLVPVAFAMCR